MPAPKNKVSTRRQHALNLLKELRELRKRMDWTQEDLAQEIGLPWVTVTRWDRGATAPTSTTTIDHIEKFLRKHRPKAKE